MQSAAREDLDLLAIKLRRAQTDYERARSRGDAERVWRSQLQMNAITSERNHLISVVRPFPVILERVARVSEELKPVIRALAEGPRHLSADPATNSLGRLYNSDVITRSAVQIGGPSQIELIDC